jgi:hypothetical protein
MKKLFIAVVSIILSSSAHAQSGLVGDGIYGLGQPSMMERHCRVMAEADRAIAKADAYIAQTKLESQIAAYKKEINAQLEPRKVNDQIIAQNDNSSVPSMREVLQDVPRDPSYQALTPQQFSEPNMERYTNSPYFQELGYIPGQDNDRLYREREREEWIQKTAISACICLAVVIISLTVANFFKKNKISIQSKNNSILLLGIIVLGTSCSKTSSTSAPPTSSGFTGHKSYINITIAGKQLETRDSFLNGAKMSLYGQPTVGLSSVSNTLSPGTIIKQVTLGCGQDYGNNGNLKVLLGGTIPESPNNNPLDTYPLSYGTFYLTDLSTGTTYSLDSNSQIIVTEVTDSFTSGKLNLKANAGGSSPISASGSFKVYKK